MTAYKREFNAPLSRYNARKRELQTSMLQYTDRFKTINAIQEEDFLADNNTSLEIRARRQQISRQSDPGHIVTRLNHSNKHSIIRRRPHSLDEKELLRNRALNQSLAGAASTSARDTKSECGHPIVIPTQSSFPSVSGPPNSPDIGRSSNVRLSFVSTSDLYDLVDFGQNTKPSQKHSTAHLSCVEDGMKLIEQIDMRSRRERKTAWSSKSKDENSDNRHSSSSTKESQNSNNDANNVLGGFITGKSIKSRHKGKNHNNKYEIMISNSKENSPHKKNILPVISSANKNEIFPLNVFLETVMSSCKESQNKLRQRPKRAKRMQLHKSDLLVIHEDGNSTTAKKEAGLGHHGQDHHPMPKRQGTPVPSNSSLTAIKEGISRHRKQETAGFFSERDLNNNHDTNSNGHIKNSASFVETSGGKSISKQKKKRHTGHDLNAIIMKNSIYPVLPWESDNYNSDINYLDHNNNTGKHRKAKRLVFLRDQPENTYRR